MSNREVQVVETQAPIFGEDGEPISYSGPKYQVLIEGDIIEENGGKFQIVKNKLGTLYKKSLGPVQPPRKVGDGFTAAELHDQYEAMTREQLSLPKGYPLYRRDSLEPGLLDVTHDISLLYKDCFNTETWKSMAIMAVNSEGKRAILHQEDGPGPDGKPLRYTYCPVFFALRVADRKDREATIMEIVRALNILGTLGQIKASFQHLSSTTVEVPGVGYQEIILASPVVKNSKPVMDLFPDLTIYEGGNPKPYRPDAI